MGALARHGSLPDLLAVLGGEGLDGDGDSARHLVGADLPAAYAVPRHAELLRQLRLRQAEPEPNAPQLLARHSALFYDS